MDLSTNTVSDNESCRAHIEVYFSKEELESITYQSLMGVSEEADDCVFNDENDSDCDKWNLLNSDAWIFCKGVCHIFAYALYKEFGYTPYIHKNLCHYFCKSDKGWYVDVRGLSERITYPGSSIIICEDEEMDVEAIKDEIKKNKNHAAGYYDFAKAIITEYYDWYVAT